MITPQTRYESIALKIVPLSSHRSVVEMRRDIAKVLETEIATALRVQQERDYPDLARSREENEVKRKELEREVAALRERERALQAREETVRQREARLTVLVQAFEGWVGWMEGQGEVSENGQRFDAVRKAWVIYKGGK